MYIEEQPDLSLCGHHTECVHVSAHGVFSYNIDTHIHMHSTKRGREGEGEGRQGVRDILVEKNLLNVPIITTPTISKQ